MFNLTHKKDANEIALIVFPIMLTSITKFHTQLLEVGEEKRLSQTRLVGVLADMTSEARFGHH